MIKKSVNADEALERLKQGNRIYLTANHTASNVSKTLIEELYMNGQHPYAVVITCSDSRVVPEHIFSCGLGELFCIRNAGNMVSPTELASAVYAAEHLHVSLIVVMGHTHCGAIEAATKGIKDGPLATLTKPIARAIGNEHDAPKASILNVQAGLKTLRSNAELRALESQGLLILGALYHTGSGRVEFLL